MNTPTHLFIHLWIKKYLKNTHKKEISQGFIWWSFAPDIGLYLVVFWYIIYAKYFLGQDWSEYFPYMFDTLYFHHPFWIFCYNLLHSALLVSIFFSISILIYKKYSQRLWFFLLWFFGACMLHIFLDFPLHHDDGPMLFYPLSDYRFMSPVSYWDSKHYGNYFAIFELFLLILLIIYITGKNFLNTLWLWKK